GPCRPSETTAPTRGSDAASVTTASAPVEKAEKSPKDSTSGEIEDGAADVTVPLPAEGIFVACAFAAAARVWRSRAGDVGHEPCRGGAVPVVLGGLEEDAVAGSDRFDRAAFALAQANAFGDPDRLPV